MKRVVVVYRCGYDATRRYDETIPGDFERQRADAAGRDCEYCEARGERLDHDLERLQARFGPPQPRAPLPGQPALFALAEPEPAA